MLRVPPAAVSVRLARPPVRPSGQMPLDGPLVDTFGRVHTDLRISVTDRCDLRCVYCMPLEGLAFSPRSETFTFEEIERVAKVARRLGVDSIRVTGGEPLQRRSLVDLVRRLDNVGFCDIALTTNGMALARHAAELAEAGLRRVNVSCDSLRPDRFAAIRRRGELHRVLQGMDAAEAAGLHPLKVNVVLMSGVNEDEVVDFADFARSTGRTVRFIEFMPLDADGGWTRDSVVPADWVLEQIGARWPLRAIDETPDHVPASRFAFTDGGGEISVTRPFCNTCNRVRLTADGSVRNCLFSDDELSVRDVMRSGGSDLDIEIVLRRAVWEKRAGHGIDDPGFLRPARSMSRIGG